MKILVDSRWIAPHGLGRFAKEVISRLSNTSSISNKIKLLSIFDPFWISYHILKIKPQVYFSPGFNPPIFSLKPFVFTIGDLIHLNFDQKNSFFIKLFYKYIIKPAIYRCFSVITFSEFSKNEIVKWSGINPNKVKIVGCGVDPTFNQFGSKFNPGFSYLLCIGNRKPHKNTERVLSSFALANIDKSIHLIISGKPNQTLLDQIQSLNISERVTFSGLISETDLPSYYRGAIALVFPSLYEGFGLPPLEAMASGTPVITSNSTSLPEVVGDAAILVDPMDIKSIASGIEQIVNDSLLRERLINLGLLQSKKFSWDKTAYLVETILSLATIKE